MRRLSLLCLSFVFITSLFAQAASQLYSTGQGLLSTRIDQITCDKDNFLWISTNQGLSRFDGSTFVNYKRQVGNPYALQENHVSSTFVDADGQYWVGASDGLYNLNRNHNELTRYYLDSIQPQIGISQILAHPLKPHTLLIGTYGFGVFAFDTETRTTDTQMSWQIQSQLKRYNCQHVMTDSHNHLWVASPTVFQCVDLEKMQAVSLKGDIPEDQVLIVQGMTEDRRHNRLYIATLNRGLLYCDLNTMKIEHVDSPEMDQRNLTCVVMSPEGDLLIGTESEGLWRMHLGRISKYDMRDCPVDLDHVKIHSITFDDQHNLWLGLFQKGLLFIPYQKRLFSCLPVRPPGSIHNLGSVSSFANMTDGSRLFGIDGEGVLQTYSNYSSQIYNTHNSGLTANAVLSVAALPGGRAYIGTYNYGMFLFEGGQVKRDPQLSILDKQSIMTMVHDSLTQILYIGTNGDGVYAYHTNTHQLKRLSGEVNLLWIVSLSLDRRHRLWVSTEGSIVCFDETTKTRFSPLYSQQIRSYGCIEDSNGTLWFATNHGLLSYGAGSDSLRVAIADGEPLAEELFSLQQSKDGHLWMPSNRGIINYDPRQQTITRYIDPEIEAIGSFSVKASITWNNGNLAFGGDNGIVDFSPEAVNAFYRPLRPIRFTRLWINNVLTDYDPTLSPSDNVLDESLWMATKLHLPASSNSFTLSFAVQEYGNPVGVRYSYHLDGYEKVWHEIHGQDISANYSSLPWGRYTLQVKAVLAAANGEIQTETKEMEIIIDAPWYASWWAILIYLALLFAILYGAFKSYRLRRHQQHIVRRAMHTRQIKEAKLRMFTSVSHEIKTPLTLIISPLRRLMKRNNDNATQSVYEMMYRSTLRILMLVNQQMDIRKLDNGQLRLHVSEISLRSFLDDMMQYFNNTALVRRIDFRLLMSDDDQDLSVWFDPDQMDKVIINLLSNAFKYVNEEGQVHIRVNANRSQRNVSIEIFNSGSKMKVNDPEHIFERFGGDGSVGLGLNLANELTQLHRGSLTVHNEEEIEGVTFCVKLQLGNDHFSDEEKLPVTSPEPTEQDQLQLEARALREEWSEPETDGKDLLDMLNDELREKQQLRERRSRLSINYNNKRLSSADEKLLTRVSDCISKNLGDSEFNVDVLAQEVGISRVHLNRKLQELIDTSPSTLIRTTRIKQGAFLLVQNNVTIAEVAYTVGFSSPAYFSSAFTAYFNMSPKEFVNTYLENPDSPELKKLLE